MKLSLYGIRLCMNLCETFVVWYSSVYESL